MSARVSRPLVRITWRDKIRNEEIRRQTRLKTLELIIKQRRLRWFGHVLRMDDDIMFKNFIALWLRCNVSDIEITIVMTSTLRQLLDFDDGDPEEKHQQRQQQQQLSKQQPPLPQPPPQRQQQQTVTTSSASSAGTTENNGDNNQRTVVSALVSPVAAAATKPATTAATTLTVSIGPNLSRRSVSYDKLTGRNFESNSGTLSARPHQSRPDLACGRPGTTLLGGHWVRAYCSQNTKTSCLSHLMVRSEIHGFQRLRQRRIEDKAPPPPMVAQN